MEKQAYQAPQMDVVQMNINKDMMLSVTSTTENGGNALAPELDLDVE